MLFCSYHRAGAAFRHRLPNGTRKRWRVKQQSLSAYGRLPGCPDSRPTTPSAAVCGSRYSAVLRIPGYGSQPQTRDDVPAGRTRADTTNAPPELYERAGSAHRLPAPPWLNLTPSIHVCTLPSCQDHGNLRLYTPVPARAGTPPSRHTLRRRSRSRSPDYRFQLPRWRSRFTSEPVAPLTESDTLDDGPSA